MSVVVGETNIPINVTPKDKDGNVMDCATATSITLSVVRPDRERTVDVVSGSWDAESSLLIFSYAEVMAEGAHSCQVTVVFPDRRRIAPIFTFTADRQL